MHGNDNDWFKTGIELREGYCKDLFPNLISLLLCQVHSSLFLIWIFLNDMEHSTNISKLVSQGFANREILSLKKKCFFQLKE